MKKILVCVVLFISAVFIPVVTSAQEAAPTPPPKYIQIFREEVKPGKTGAHAKNEARYASLFKKSNAISNYTAMVSVAGPNEAWFITRYDSFAAWEKDVNASDTNPMLQAEQPQLDAADGELLSRSSGIIARYREDLSYRPGVNIPRMHCFSITVVRVRPGHNNEFEDARKLVKATHEKLGLKDNHSVYQVMSGYPAGTFLIITPYRNLADLEGALETHGKAYDDALGEDGQKKLRDLASSAVNGADTLYFEVDPKISFPAKETIAADPDFWAP
jgi:quinol monooxygenase YgiN